MILRRGSSNENYLVASRDNSTIGPVFASAGQEVVLAFILQTYAFAQAWAHNIARPHEWNSLSRGIGRKKLATIHWLPLIQCVKSVGVAKEVIRSFNIFMALLGIAASWLKVG